MNEDQATALFAPARERPVPPAAFTMDDVFAADDRLRHRRRKVAVVASVAAVVIAVVGAFALSSTGASRSVRPATVPPTPAPSVRVAPWLSGMTLAAVLSRVSVPSGSVEVATDPLAGSPSSADPLAGYPGYVKRSRYWTTTLTPKAAFAAVTAQLPDGTQLTASGKAGFSASYAAPDSVAVDGPHLDLLAVALPSGKTALSASAWEVVKPAKTSADRVQGNVTSVTGTLTDSSSEPVTVSRADAQLLARDINALPVHVDLGHQDCGQVPEELVLMFQTAQRDEFFQSTCGFVKANAVNVKTNQLTASSAFNVDVHRIFASLYQGTAGAATVGLPPSLNTVLDGIQVPPGSTQTGAAAVPGPAGQGSALVVDQITQTRFWRSPLSRDATLAWIKAHLPTSWSGGVVVPQGDQRAVGWVSPVNAYEFGPDLSIFVAPDGSGSAITVRVVEQPRRRKTTAETLTNVTAATLTTVPDGGSAPKRTIQLTPDQVRQLAADVNALQVARLVVSHGCMAGNTSRLLTFTTGSGERRFLADYNCGGVSLVGSKGWTGLEDSKALASDMDAALKADGQTHG